MKFRNISGDDRLWAVQYDGDSNDCLTRLFENWLDINYLTEFFSRNYLDLQNYFRIVDIDAAIFDTMDDAMALKCMILDIEPDTNLDKVFRPLENFRSGEMLLSKEKAKGQRLNSHPSWLRIYAIKMGQDAYLVTGGAIKLTFTMAEREHTLKELERMEYVRNFLINEGIVDIDGFKEMIQP